MARESNATLYFRLYKKKFIQAGNTIRFGDIAQIIVEDSLFDQLHALPIAHASVHEGSHQLIDILTIIARIQSQFPELHIEHYGEPHIMIEMKVSTKHPWKIWIVAVWLLLFVGSGLAIMNFHEDVSMLQVHQRIFELLTGTRNESPRIIQIPYSLGIGLGMVIFFNHIFKKKLNDEPSPLEVEMFTYQESIHQYMVTEEYGKNQNSRLLHQVVNQEHKRT